MSLRYPHYFDFSLFQYAKYTHVFIKRNPFDDLKLRKSTPNRNQKKKRETNQQTKINKYKKKWFCNSSNDIRPFLQSVYLSNLCEATNKMILQKFCWITQWKTKNKHGILFCRFLHTWFRIFHSVRLYKPAVCMHWYIYICNIYAHL